MRQKFPRLQYVLDNLNMGDSIIVENGQNHAYNKNLNKLRVIDILALYEPTILDRFVKKVEITYNKNNKKYFKITLDN